MRGFQKEESNPVQVKKKVHYLLRDGARDLVASYGDKNNWVGYTGKVLLAVVWEARPRRKRRSTPMHQVIFFPLKGKTCDPFVSWIHACMA